MACQREHRGLAVTRQCLRLGALAIAAGTAGLMAVPAAAAPAGPAGPGAAARPAETRPHPWIAITSVQPGFAQPTKKITIAGMVANPGRSALRAVSVELWSSASPLTSQGMASYLTAPEPSGVDTLIAGAVRNLPPVPAHATEQWSLTLTASQVGMHTFGVYPLSAHLASGGIPMDSARTFLPFWPGKPASRAVKPVSIAWVWPLIDTPQQTVCRTLASNELAGSVTQDGRLNSLLAVGQTPAARRAMLTWAIDPALLSDVSVMTAPYRTGGSISSGGNCSHGSQKPASGAAKAWLDGVQAVAAQQDYFTTPYADVDAAALLHGGLNSQLKAAFADGSRAAAQTRAHGAQAPVLGQAQRVSPATVGPIAWPADGIADYGVLEGLAADQIKTVILDSTMMPPHGQVTNPPGAVTTLPDGQGGQLNILLADDTLAQILAARRDQIPGLVPASFVIPAGARTQARQAAAFAKEQWFLAETAMIAAGSPTTSRSVVVTPPRRWNPLPGMATALLTETDTAPWLRPATLAGLTSAGPPAGEAARQRPAPNRVNRAELRKPLLHRLGRLDEQIRLLTSILTRHGDNYLGTALDTAESSVWRGRWIDQRPAKQLVRRDMAYVSGQLRQVRIVGSHRVALGGQNGVVPVSVSNSLNQPVTVRLVATAPRADHVVIGKFTSVITVQAHEQRTIKLSVTVPEAGAVTLTLSLATEDGKHLPVGSSSLTVVATHFGTLAIVIISIALVVFVLTAAARAIRRGGPQDGGSGAEAEELDAMPSTRDPASAADEPDSVVSRGADDRQPAKEADEHASTPGRADRS